MPKIKVCELARRLSIVSNTTVTSADVVAWAEAAGVRVGLRGGLDESQAYVVLRTTRWGGSGREIRQLVAEEWPPQDRSWAVGYTPTPPRPVSPSHRVRWVGPPLVEKPVISESARRAAAAARPAPPPRRPLSMPTPVLGPGPDSRRRPRRDGKSPSVRVDSLSSLVRAVLPAELRGRERISAHEAQRWREEANRWAREGFDNRSVVQWLDTELTPRDAGYLASRRVDPTVVYKIIPVPVTVMATGHATVGLMLTSGRLPMETVYDLLVQAGHHVPEPEPEFTLTLPEKAAAARPAAPAVVFSDPGDVNAPAPAVSSKRRRTAKAIQDGTRPRRRR